MNSTMIIQFLLGVLLGLLGVISFILGIRSGDFSLLILFILFIVFGYVIGMIFVNIKNYNKILYVITTTVLLFLSTIVYSILIPNNALISFVIYFPFIAGVLSAIAIATYSLEIEKLMNEGLILLKKKNYSEALEKFDRVLELNSKYYAARFNRANILYDLEKYDEALDEADELLDRDKNDLLALNIRSQSLLKLGEKDEALEIVEGILENPPKNQGAIAITIVNKGEILFEMGNYLEAISCYDEALVKIPSKKALFRQGFRFTYLCFFDNQIAEIWFKKGKAHQKLQQYSEALECFNKALKLDPDSEDAKNTREEILSMNIDLK